MSTKFNELKLSFKDAIARLAEVLVMDKNDVIRDSAIQRFEFTFELSWKTIKAHLEEKGIHCTSPYGCFREAYRQGVIEYEQIWLDLIKARNETVHTYNREVAEKIYAQLPAAAQAFQKLLATLERPL